MPKSPAQNSLTVSSLFQYKPSQKVTFAHNHFYNERRRRNARTFGMSMQNDKNNNIEYELDQKSNNSPDVQSTSRRHLLFSMLTTTAFSLTATSVSASSIEEAVTSSTTNVIADGAVPAANALVSITNIIKPPLDNRDYEYYILPNGLRVLLCSDPSSNRAAAAMDVHVGAEADPKEIPVSSTYKHQLYEL